MDDYFDLKYADIVAKVRALEAAAPGGAARFNIAFLRNITLDTVVPYLKYLCLTEGIIPCIYMSGFDEAASEALSPSSALYGSAPDLIILALTLDTLSERLATGFAGLSADEVSGEIEKVAGQFSMLLSSIRRNSASTIIVHGIQTPPWPSFGIGDFHHPARHTAAISLINNKIREIAQETGNVYMLDIDRIASRTGLKAFFNMKMNYLARIPYSSEAFRNIASEYMKFIRARLGRNRKCLVLDCDNTLWGGIVGEDGIENIKLDGNFPGSCYKDIQKAALDLYHRGVILAICSRNDEQDVLNVLENHPDMVLRREHFACIRANWSDKASNIREIADELNIGMDSMVFIDDSEMEVSIVRELVPEVASFLLPREVSAAPQMLRSLGLFDTLEVSEEDKKRGSMYRAESERKKLRTAEADLEKYLASLEMEITIAKADALSIPRITQLISKTNQFNMTTKRYSQSDVERFSAADDSEVLCLHYKDRFGDMGIVGAAVMRFEKSQSLIDTFLLSCRALGRNIEHIFIRSCAELCRARSSAPVVGLYSPTAKNTHAAGFYEARGFRKFHGKDDMQRFVLDADSPLPDCPGIYRLINSFPEGDAR